MSQEPEKEYRCEECGTTFDSGVEWERHNRQVHSRYTCETCHNTFSAEEEFASHNFKLHPELQKIQR
ncbi:MAG TPA: C2H2-type zinc finger protein [Anaerolineales bacterium]|nr:C2H2-type zinc finger protein [Anaerolineales bacterium]